MIFIAKNADYSTNKIGVATLDFSEKTKAVLLAFNNTELSINEKLAIDTYVNMLVNNGILNKIKHFYLPIIAGTNLSKTFINIAKDTLDVEITPDPTYFAIANKGIYNLGGTTSLQLLVPTAADGLNADNFTVFSYLSKFTNTEITTPTISLAPTNMTWQVPAGLFSYGNDYLPISGDRLKINNIAPSIAIVDGGTASQLKLGLKSCGFGFSLNQSDGNGGHYINENGIVTRYYTAGVTRYTFGALVKDLYMTGFNNASMKQPNGVIAIGSALTSSELQTLNDLTKVFMTGMGAENI